MDPWNIGIDAENSIEKTQKAPNVLVNGGGVATSGDVHRYLLKDGIRYSHVLNAKTGWPAKNSPRTVTVAAANCTEAGLFSTLAMLHGENAEAFLKAQEVVNWVVR